MTIQEAEKLFYQRVQLNAGLREIQARVNNGTATFEDTFQYTDIVSDILGNVLSQNMTSTPDGERQKLCEYLLRHLYSDTNEMCAAVQKSLDKAQNLHIAPQTAPFPENRVRKMANSLEDKTVPEETIQRRAASSATIGRSFHDDYIRTNAAFRESAGLRSYITRMGGAKCCDWCAGVSGKFTLNDAPDGIWGRHDNCKCSIIYDSKRGGRQLLQGKPTPDGSSKGWTVTGEEPQGFQPHSFKSGEKPQGFSPVAFSAETAPQGFSPAVLTGGAKHGTMSLMGTFFKEGDDPMFTAFGRAEDSNPKELAELQARLTAIGVSFVRHDEDGAALAYQNTRLGEPGSISVIYNASYSAWLHEAQHAFDDYAAGWDSCFAAWDVEEHIRREERAYQVEIDYAQACGRPDIAELLKQNLANEIAEIRRRDEEYAKQYEIYGEGGA